MAEETKPEPIEKPEQAAPKKEAAPRPFEEKYAKLITEKVNAGLRREDAIQVIKHQLENDARVAKAAAK